MGWGWASSCSSLICPAKLVVTAELYYKKGKKNTTEQEEGRLRMAQEDYVKPELQAKKDLQEKQKKRLIGSKDLE